MPVPAPKLHTWLSNGHSARAEEIWEIGAPAKNSLSWSLVLSYAMSCPCNETWERSLGLFLGDAEEVRRLMLKKNIEPYPLKLNGIRKQILNFNPFKNRHSVYFNKNVADVIRIFDLRLNQTANKQKQRGEEWNDFLKLKTVSSLLACRIQVYAVESTGEKEQIAYFPKEHDVDSTSRNGRIVLFKHVGVDTGNRILDVFYFGMSCTHALRLRMDALGHFLNKAKMNSDSIRNIQKDFHESSNFLLFLLTKGWQDTIPVIYKSPYIAWKLADAGFNTDPCLPGRNGLSAFYYSILLDTTGPLYILYDYASNNFQQLLNATTRNPDSEIVGALENIANTINRDFKSKPFETLDDREHMASKTCTEILRFNEYQHYITKSIFTIIEDSRTGRQKKRIIRSILDTYSRYFQYGSTSQKDKYEELQDYINFSEYYENLDNFTCLLFFDNCLYMKLSTEAEDHFKNTVQCLFLTVFGYRLFRKCVHGVHCRRCSISAEDRPLRFIPLICRQQFLKSANDLLIATSHFSEESEEDPNVMVEKIRSCLKSMPDIKDEFLISRLDRYLSTALDVSLAEDGIKGVLAIERALQVIGETLKTSAENIIGHLLCSCLPQETVKQLFDIRNNFLSHYRPATMHSKLIMEKNIPIFKDLQEVLNQIEKMVQPVYLSQKQRLVEFMLEKGLEEAKAVSETIFQKIKRAMEHITHHRRSIYRENKGKYKLLSNNFLEYFQIAIENVDGTKELRGQMSAWKFLITFVAAQSNNTLKKNLLDSVHNLEDLISKNIDKDFTPEMKTDMVSIFSSQRKILQKVFEDVKQEDMKKSAIFSKLQVFLKDMRETAWFSDKELRCMEKKVLEHFEKSREAKESLKDSLKRGLKPSTSDVKKLLENFFANENIKDEIFKNFSINPKQTLKKLDAIRGDKKDISFKNLQELIQFSEKEEGRNLLLRIEFPGFPLLAKRLGQFINRKMECLSDRIRLLKEVLIDDDDEISHMWSYGRSQAIKRHTRFLMSQRYAKEKDTRSALEMLLFDCMNIIKGNKNRQDLEHLWIKATHLFTGANLRDILSHGNTILETVGGLLDPEDLPCEFIDKMLKLIEDGEAISSISLLWQQLKPKDLPEFIAVIKSEEQGKTLAKKIKKCGEWEDYLKLLPLK